MDKTTFNNYISKQFWKHIFSKTYVEHKAIVDRESFLNKLFDEIQSYSYNPSVPREYIVSNKYNLVSRIVPVLNLKDICVYYFCIKTLEENLAKNRVKGTYGGFSSGGLLRKREDKEFNGMMEIPFSSSPYSFNPHAWVAAWRDFQKKAFIFSKNYSYFIKFDISNFYDSINLTLLERKIRANCHETQSETINLLFHFLKNWNKRFENYFPKTVGIPQDEVGDCSRILANFYLQEFDNLLLKFCQKKGMDRLRYSDDMFIMSNNLDLAKEALFYASKELSKSGLNINPAKVHIFQSKVDFNNYWAFEIFNKLADPNDNATIETAIELYKKYLDNYIEFRSDSVLKRIVNCDIMNIDITKKQFVLNQLLNEEFLMNIEEFSLRRIYSFLSKSDKDLLNKKLESLVAKVLFNKFHYVLLKTYDLHKINKTIILKRIKELTL